jgi:hypothetical protein
LLILAAAAYPQTAAADEGATRPVIVEAKVYVTGRHIVGDITVRHLFSKSVAGTVQSGLPAVVELMFRMIEGRSRLINQGLVAYELRYDVWEDRYTIAVVDSTRIYPTFDAMGRAMENLKQVSLGFVDMLEVDTEYSFEFGIAVHPLRSKDKREIEGWVSENVRGGAETPRHQQVLNINELIEHFFLRNKDDATRSRWYRSAAFTRDGLRFREVE